MSVVSSESETSVQAGPMLRVEHIYTFHTGERYVERFETVDLGLDVDLDRAARVPNVEINMRNSEIERLVMDVTAAAEGGDLPDIMAILPVHQETDNEFTRKRRFRRQLLRWAVRHRDLKVVRRIFYAVWFWLKFDSGFTGQQIADYLAIPLATVTAIDARMQAIHDNLAFIDTDSEFEVD